MTIYGPACTCPPDTRRLPHLDGCPRYDDDRVWSIEDRAECRQQTTPVQVLFVDQDGTTVDVTPEAGE